MKAGPGACHDTGCTQVSCLCDTHHIGRTHNALCPQGCQVLLAVRLQNDGVLEGLLS